MTGEEIRKKFPSGEEAQVEIAAQLAEMNAENKIRFSMLFAAVLAIVGMLACLAIKGAAQQSQDLGQLHDAPKPKVSKLQTIANFAGTAVDMGQTCYHLAEGWREKWTPSQNCGTIVALNFGRAAAAYLLDRLLLKYKHGRWAHAQEISIGISGTAIGYTVLAPR